MKNHISLLVGVACLLGCSADDALKDHSPVSELRPAVELALNDLRASNPTATQFSLYWVTNRIPALREMGAPPTQDIEWWEMSALAFVWRRPSDTNCMTYVTTDETLAVVGTRGFLEWFDSNFTNMPSTFMRRLETQQPLSRIQE
jgi:hypothetical protein